MKTKSYSLVMVEFVVWTLAALAPGLAAAERGNTPCAGELWSGVS